MNGQQGQFFAGMPQQRQRVNRWDVMPGNEQGFELQGAGMAPFGAAANAMFAAQRVANRLHQQQVQQQAEYLAALEHFTGREQQMFGPAAPQLGYTVGSNVNRLAPYLHAQPLLPERPSMSSGPLASAGTAAPMALMPHMRNYKPPVYDDKAKKEKRDLETFLRDVVQYCQMCNVKVSQTLPFLLGGEVRAHYDRITLGDVPADQFVERPDLDTSELFNIVRTCVGADLVDESFTAATNLIGPAKIAMKPDELVSDYVLRFRQTVSKLGPKSLSDSLQAFVFVMNLTTELKEECGTQRDGKPWPDLNKAVDAAIGAQRRLKTAQTGKRARLAAVHAVDCEQDYTECDERQDAGDTCQYLEQENVYVDDAERHTLAAVQQRRPGAFSAQPAQRKPQPPYSNQNRSAGYGNRSNFHNSNGNAGYNRQTYNGVSATRHDQQPQPAPAAKSYEDLKRMMRSTCKLHGWCYSCGSDRHTTARCDGSGPFGKAMPKMNQGQQH